MHKAPRGLGHPPQGETMQQNQKHRLLRRSTALTCRCFELCVFFTCGMCMNLSRTPTDAGECWSSEALLSRALASARPSSTRSPDPQLGQTWQYHAQCVLGGCNCTYSFWGMAFSSWDSRKPDFFTCVHSSSPGAARSSSSGPVPSRCPCQRSTNSKVSAICQGFPLVWPRMEHVRRICRGRNLQRPVRLSVTILMQHHDQTPS